MELECEGLMSACSEALKKAGRGWRGIILKQISAQLIIYN
jgi:hypothetical protein